MSITVGVIGVIALIISLDTWKIQEKYKSNKDYHENIVNKLNDLKKSLNNLMRPGQEENFDDFHDYSNLFFEVNNLLVEINYEFKKIGSLIDQSHNLSNNYILSRQNPEILTKFLEARKNLNVIIDQIIFDILSKNKL
ncbi:MAG: hypothetical protein ACK4GH_05000 [Acinetobacter johnsonii]